MFLTAPISCVNFLIVCPLVFLAGFVDAVAGGGGLISLPAYMISGIPVHFAIGTNKLSSGMGTSIATWQYAKRGYIPWKQAGACVICALLGSSAGAHLALLIDDRIFKVVMLIILPVTAVYVMRTKSLKSVMKPYKPASTLLISLAAALVIGAYDGFYGPGTGTFLILCLIGLAHMKLSEANGVAKVINLTTNIAALFVYFTNGKVYLVLGLTAGVFSIFGNYIGSRCFDKGGAKLAKPFILTVLFIFFVRVILEKTGVI